MGELRSRHRRAVANFASLVRPVAPRLARAHFVRHRMRPVAVSMNPAFSSSASRGELRFARAPRRGVDESCVLVIGEPWRTSLRSCAPSRLDSPARDLAPRRFAPSRQILRSRASRSPALTSFATECAPLRLDSPALTSCATECAPSRLDSPAAHFVRYRMRPVAPRLARRACPIVAIERLCFASIVH